MTHSWLLSGVILTTKWDDPPSTPYVLVFLWVMVTSPFHTFCQIGSWWPLQPTQQPVGWPHAGALCPPTVVNVTFEHPTNPYKSSHVVLGCMLISGYIDPFTTLTGGPPSRTTSWVVVSQKYPARMPGLQTKACTWRGVYRIQDFGDLNVWKHRWLWVSTGRGVAKTCV